MTAGPQYHVRAEVWRHPGKGGWHFANLSRRQSREIRTLFGSRARAWGSLPVTVRIGRTEWDTSIFPDRKSNTYLIAIKAYVRLAEDVRAGDTIRAVLRVRWDG